MVLRHVTVYHHQSSRFAAYTPGDELIEVMSHYRDLPACTEPEQVAAWVFHILNADLVTLEHARANAGGESGFLLACTYRLLGLRPLSVGDVAAVTVEDRTTWLACEPFGWRPIDTPAVVSRQPLTAEAVYQRLRQGRDA
ncbi:hypothetical protein DMB66_23965 [Actinoplanes sp. ATCC 53533]|uniref:hypothetical protein n=1 Tax=Actinoplanes sp. ATCC 53533 TaxID=1288362 RepID=UPI000F769E16|nr:hypothetical protein [Actinoplanes sp. ATCC 53533]RSM61759.1 hypothetical protein DMB66_23965 [Actinoplanes sp. ATCC 53533]